MRVPAPAPLLALAAALGGCAAPAAPPQPASAEEHHTCLDRMYAMRMRGAVHWHIYENCLRERR